MTADTAAKPAPQKTANIPDVALIAAVAQDLGLPAHGVAAVIALTAEGATVPFIARYRKERTGSLDEVQIRDIVARATYLRELEDRRATILASVEEQGKLTEALKKKILACTEKRPLEDLYLPFRPKRRTRATIAKEKGLEPLALRILAQPTEGDPKNEAAEFISEELGVEDIDVALAGARDIIIETIAEDAKLRARVREVMTETGDVCSEVSPDKKDERTKFEDYYGYNEPVAKMPSHRVLALRRGEAEGVLRVRISVDSDPLVPEIERHIGLQPESPFAGELRTCTRDALSKKLLPSMETEVRVELKMRADREAVGVFADNLENLLLAPPLGGKATVAIDPGLRTGSKCVALDATGRMLGHITIYPARGAGAEQQAKADLAVMLMQKDPDAVAVGNGTGGRETEKLVREIVKEAMLTDIQVVSVNEAGASIYSASDVAREEFPDLDLTLRGAISIGRRLQDPLAELVKLDPKSIGVGQYQHDVHQPLLQQKLHDVVESCVNRVGVNINTASASLLSYVAGVGPTVAKRIVAHREAKGAFSTREDLLSVSGMGRKTFEQAAGFLRIPDGKHPLDASAVHPERYELLERMADDADIDLGALVGNSTATKNIRLEDYVCTDNGAEVGLPTLRDIISELEKPGRDPRKEFAPLKFRDDVNSLADLREGMQLQGVVTNVTDFGAFVDVGVHQDGLVHVSQLADRFIKHPNEATKVGERIKVTVMSIDLDRRRVSLSARSDAGAAPQDSGDNGGKTGGRPAPRNSSGPGKPRQGKGRPSKGRNSGPKRDSFANNPFANLLGKS